MLQRAAGPAGVDLPDAADQGFADISELGSAFQAAVNQMAALGIMTGTTATTFDPDGIVSRTTIVEALAGFLTSARVGPGGKALTRNADRSLTLKDSTAANAKTISFDETFRDIGVATFSAFESIRALAEMGVVSGRGDGTFGPLASVTRGQAASFITRALAHTNARPAGVTVQASKSEVTSADELSLLVSARGSDFSPRDSASIDVFSYATASAAGAFKSDGTCQTTGRTAVAAVAGTGGSVACVIEVDDDVTDPAGNVMIDVDTPARPTTYWVWTGAAGDSLDWDEANLSMDDTALSDAASASVTTTKAPSSAKVTTSVSSDATDGNTVRYGTTVTVTIQLVDSAGQPVASAGHAYQWWSAGQHAPNPDRRPLSGTRARTVTTDADGRVSFTLTQADPDTNKDVDGPGEDDDADDSTTWTYYIAKLSPTAPNLADTAFGDDDDGIFAVMADNRQGSGTLVFDDDNPAATKLSVELARAWTSRPAAGSTGRVGVTGKVTDQYGAPMRGHPIYFDLDGNNTFGCETWVASTSTCTTPGTGDNTIDTTTGRIDGATRRLTRSNGTNTISAVFPSASPPVGSHFVYRVATNLNASDTDMDVADPGEMAMKTHYWVYDPSGWNSETGIAPAGQIDGRVGTNDNGALRRIRLVDYDNNVIIRDTKMPGDVWEDKNNLWRYRDGDIFWWYVRGSGDNPDAQGWRYLSAAEFESYMARHMAQGGMDGGTTPYASFYASGVEVDVRQYSTVTGFSVFRVRLDTGDDIADPPTP